MPPGPLRAEQAPAPDTGERGSFVAGVALCRSPVRVRRSVSRRSLPLIGGMYLASHVFVTAKYLDRCVETGLFGVTVQQVNYLAPVFPGDTAFLLETGTGRIAGPFSIAAPLFMSQTPVWEQPDKFTYRLRLAGSE